MFKHILLATDGSASAEHASKKALELARVHGAHVTAAYVADPYPYIGIGEVNPMAFTRDYSVMLLVSVIFALLCWRRPRQIGRGAGALLTGGFIIWLAMLYWLSPLLVG